MKELFEKAGWSNKPAKAAVVEKTVAPKSEPAVAAPHPNPLPKGEGTDFVKPRPKAEGD
jgi:hypothetical protein